MSQSSFAVCFIIQAPDSSAREMTHQRVARAPTVPEICAFHQSLPTTDWNADPKGKGSGGVSKPRSHDGPKPKATVLRGLIPGDYRMKSVPPKEDAQNSCPQSQSKGKSKSGGGSAPKGLSTKSTSGGESKRNGKGKSSLPEGSEPTARSSKGQSSNKSKTAQTKADLDEYIEGFFQVGFRENWFKGLLLNCKTKIEESKGEGQGKSKGKGKGKDFCGFGVFECRGRRGPEGDIDGAFRGRMVRESELKEVPEWIRRRMQANEEERRRANVPTSSS